MIKYVKSKIKEQAIRAIIMLIFCYFYSFKKSSKVIEIIRQAILNVKKSGFDKQEITDNTKIEIETKSALFTISSISNSF